MTDNSRDSWCTPKWLAELIGEVDLDPCSNTRSWIKAKDRYTIADDGLKYRHWITSNTRTFINPPYSRGSVINWVRTYMHTDFRFLLRFDPSTEWFALLMSVTQFVWFSDIRIQFEPPPDVSSSSNPFPNAVFFREIPPKQFGTRGFLLRAIDVAKFYADNPLPGFVSTIDGTTGY